MKISKVLENRSDILKAALDNDDKRALEQYKNSITFNYENIDLRPWQSDLMKFLEKPDDRHVICVNGSVGNEGKDIFPKIYCVILRQQKVVNLDLVKNTNDLGFIPFKQNLACKDIFFSMFHATSVSTIFHMIYWKELRMNN